MLANTPEAQDAAVDDPLVRLDLDMDLRDLVCAFMTLGGVANLYFAGLLFAAGREAYAPSPSVLAPSSTDPAFMTRGGLFFGVIGGAQFVLVLMLLVGPWRKPDPVVFPMRVLDLNAPPAAIENALASNAQAS